MSKLNIKKQNGVSRRKLSEEMSISNPQESKNKSGLYITSTQISIPLPPPEILEKYEKINKGSFDRILKIAEKEQSYRQKKEMTLIEMDDKFVNKDLNIQKYSVFTSSLLLFSLTTVGAILILFDKDIAGIVSLFSTPVFIAISKIWDTFGNKSEKDPSTDQT